MRGIVIDGGANQLLACVVSDSPLLKLSDKYLLETISISHRGDSSKSIFYSPLQYALIWIEKGEKREGTRCNCEGQI